MRVLRKLLLGCVAASVMAGAARADDQWTTVTLDNDPDFTIDVPTVVADDYKPGASEPEKTLMNFSVSAYSSGPSELLCLLSFISYPENPGHENITAWLARDDEKSMCDADSDTIHDWELYSYSKMTVNGAPSAVCSSAFTNTHTEFNGVVRTVMAVVGHTTSYLLVCYVYGDDKDKAIAAYEQTWKSDIEHIQHSLNIPAAEK